MYRCKNLRTLEFKSLPSETSLSRPGRQPSSRSDHQHQHTEIVFLPWKTSQLKLLFEQNSNVIKQGNCRSNIIECKMSQ